MVLSNGAQLSSGHNIKSQEESDLDLNRAGLETVPHAQGIEALPSEKHGKPAPQAVTGPEKEVVVAADKEAIVQNDIPAEPKGILKTATSRRRRNRWLIVAAVALIIIIVIAIAVPLGTRAKQKTALYVRNLSKLC